MKRYKVKKNTETDVFEIVDEKGEVKACYDNWGFAEMVAGKYNLVSENARLKELNREMVATLKRVNEVIIEYQSGLIAEYLVEIIEPILAKAEGES